MVLSTYLMRTTVAGGLLGGIHGVMTLDRATPGDLDRIVRIAYHLQIGAVMGPWFPISIPILFRLHGNTTKIDCPIMKVSLPSSTEEQQEIPPTVAEKP